MSHKNYSRKPVEPRKRALWVSAYPKQVRPPKAKPEPKKRLSEVRRRKYNLAAKAFLKQWPLCACHNDLMKMGTECGKYAGEVHHFRGRLGPLLLDQRFWVPVCRTAHVWIDANRKLAREFGWLCELGDWNKPSPT